MKKKKGLSTSQIICIILLWAAFCVIMFTVPNTNPVGVNIFWCIASGIIILIGIRNGIKKANRNDRR